VLGNRKAIQIEEKSKYVATDPSPLRPKNRASFVACKAKKSFEY
jgi:hypothetical protein